MRNKRFLHIAAAFLAISLILITGSGCNRQSPPLSSPKAEGTGSPGGSSLHADSEEPKAFFGEWVVESVPAYGQVGTYTKEEAESLIGTALTFSSGQATVLNDQPSRSPTVIQAPVYGESTLSAQDFLAQYRMNPGILGITTPVIEQITVTSPDQTAGCTLLVKDRDHLILVTGGTYFSLARVS